jgi:hypothetical protein
MHNAEQPTEPRRQFLAGHQALAFLNTRMRVLGELLDLVQSGEDVFADDSLRALRVTSHTLIMLKIAFMAN